MTDLEKKEFFQNFIDYIEIYPDKKANERVLKRIHFRFPVFYNGQLGDTLWLRNENGVETCCAMHRRDA
jgi:site-specific DNA recombinase